MHVANVTSHLYTANAPTIRKPHSGYGATASTDTVTISQAAREIASNIPNNTANHDFTNMSPYEFGQLMANGELQTDGCVLLTEAQFQEIAKAHFNGTPVNTEQNADSAFYAKTDYLRLYANAIRSSRAYGLDTTGMERVLNQMKALQSSEPRA